jgi:hypothetical protein
MFKEKSSYEKRYKKMERFLKTTITTTATNPAIISKITKMI